MKLQDSSSSSVLGVGGFAARALSSAILLPLNSNKLLGEREGGGGETHTSLRAPASVKIVILLLVGAGSRTEGEGICSVGYTGMV